MSHPPVSEVQTPSGALTPSIVRTGVPLVVGLIVTWAVQKLGLLDLDTATSGAVTSGIAAWIYYTMIRFLEVYASPKWGYILGIGRVPVYPEKSPPVTVQVPSEPEGGSADVGYVAVAAGLVLLVLALFTPLPPWLWMLGLVLLVIGVVLMAAGRNRV